MPNHKITPIYLTRSIFFCMYTFRKMSDMQSLVSRLETVTSRLERLAAQGGARGGGAAEGEY